MIRLVALLALASSFASAGSAQQVAPGRLAPEIDLPALGGGRIRLSTLRGHPVVVTFWGTWCPPCRAEFPELVAVQRAHAAAGLRVVGVNQRDQELSLRDVEAFVKEYGVEFPVALDGRGKSRRSFRLVALPTTVFIDSVGVIRRITSGPTNRAELDRGLAMILPPN